MCLQNLKSSMFVIEFLKTDPNDFSPSDNVYRLGAREPKSTVHMVTKIFLTEHIVQTFDYHADM